VCTNCVEGPFSRVLADMTGPAGKDVYWYTRDKSRDKVSQDEVSAVKSQEEQLMAEVC
jgi:hypothetical protein